MAAEGYILQKVNTITRQFYFKKGKPQQFVYRIIFEKTSGQILPDTLIIRISRSILYYLRVKSNLQ